MSDKRSDSKPADPRTTMAEERTDLAYVRTIWAADRTLMAWVRTAISMIGFGFTIYKFFQYLREAERAILLRPQGPRNLGLTLIALGTGAIVLASIHYWQFVRTLTRERPATPWSMTLIIALLVALIGAILFFSTLLKLGPF